MHTFSQKLSSQVLCIERVVDLYKKHFEVIYLLYSYLYIQYLLFTLFSYAIIRYICIEYELDMWERSSVKVLKSRSAADYLHSDVALAVGDITRAAAAEAKSVKNDAV